MKVFILLIFKTYLNLLSSILVSFIFVIRSNIDTLSVNINNDGGPYSSKLLLNNILLKLILCDRACQMPTSMKDASSSVIP